MILTIAYILKGQVVDSLSGKPLPYCAISTKKSGTYTDEEGFFKLELEGEVILEVSLVGYRTKRISLNVTKDTFLTISLHPYEIILNEAEIFSERKESDEEMDMITVYRTPGAMADIFHSLKFASGISSSRGDNSALSIQGGRIWETGIYVNGLLMRHAYHYEGTGGGIFSVIDEALVSNIEIYKAGFPLEYPYGLSGVVDIKLRRFEEFGGQVSMSMAGVSGLIHTKHMGISFERSYTELILGSSDEYTYFPTNWSIQGSFEHNNLGVLFILAGDQVGMKFDTYEIPAKLSNYNRKGLFGIYYGNTYTNISMGYSFLKSITSIHIWNMETYEETYQINSLFKDGNLSFGMNFLSISEESRYILPRDTSLIFYETDSQIVDGSKIGRTLGSFFQLNLHGLSIGSRLNYYVDEGDLGIYPRISKSALFGNNLFRFTVGYYGEMYEGRIVEALHVSSRIERGVSKVGVFYKKYTDIGKPVYGMELSFEMENFRLSYTYTKAFEEYDRPHNVSMVFQKFLTNRLELGLSFRYMSGKPYTPVVGREEVSPNIYKPIYGEPYSERLPDYKRMDMRLNFYSKLFGKFLVSFLEVQNIFNFKNVEGYIYSRDYTRRYELRGVGLMVVGGFVLLF